MATTPLAHAPSWCSTRPAGVSAPPFDSLNFGNPGELPPHIARDPKANIERNFAILRGQMEAAFPGASLAARRIEQVHQVHGADVLVVRRSANGARRSLWRALGGVELLPDHQNDEPGCIHWGDVRADALVSDDPSRLLVVRVADCCPVLMATTDGRVVAAVHAGWRGVVAGVAPRAVRALKTLAQDIGADASIRAHIGPCISARALEVGPEVVAEMHNAFGTDAPVVTHLCEHARRAGKAMVDLQAGLAHQLRREQVEITGVDPRCTHAHSELFFSHRRDKGITGRMVAAIGTLNR
jgi:polyphenol oxidase